MHRYLVVIEKSDDTFSVYFPDLQGCDVTGATREDGLPFLCLRPRPSTSWVSDGALGPSLSMVNFSHLQPARADIDDSPGID